MLKSYLKVIIIKENGEKERSRKGRVGDTLYREDCDTRQKRKLKCLQIRMKSRVS